MSNSFTIVGEYPMDTEVYDLGTKPTLDEAKKIADKFCAQDPAVTTAEVRDSDGTVVYDLGSI